jgi:general secretion pathway protein N
MKLIRNLLILVVVLVLLAGLVLAFLPARIALDFVGPRIGPVELGEVSGSLWKGQVNPAKVNGESIGTLGWTLHPLSLFGARIDADVTLRGDVYNGSTELSVRRDRSVQVRDLDLRFAAQRLEPMLDIPALVFRGEVQVAIAAAELRGGFPTSLSGNATWKDASVAGSAEARFGDLLTDFATAPDGSLRGTVRDSGGPLQASGEYSASVLGYDAAIDLRARDANPQVLEALQYIGQPQPDGSTRLEVRGKLLGDF